MNPCPTRPVCEFGEYGCEARTWWSEREIHVDGLSMVRCQWGDGGVYGMCGHRPLTELERLLGIIRGDRMGQRPEVDTVNVRTCDGTLAVHACTATV